MTDVFTSHLDFISTRESQESNEILLKRCFITKSLMHARMHPHTGEFSGFLKGSSTVFGISWVGTSTGWRRWGCFGLTSIQYLHFLSNQDKFPKSSHIPVSTHYHIFSLLKSLLTSFGNPGQEFSSAV